MPRQLLVSFFIVLFTHHLQTSVCLRIRSRVNVSTNYNNENDPPFLDPQEMGSLHNQIVMQVHDRLADHTPENQEDYLEIVFDEMAIFCESDDDDEDKEDCRRRLEEDAVQSQQDIEQFFTITNLEHYDELDVLSHVPTELHRYIRAPLLQIIDSIRLLKHNNTKEVMDRIDKVILTYKVDTNSNNGVFLYDAIQTVASIAVGSTQLWMDARNDPENEFYRFHMAMSRNDRSRNRRRQLASLVSNIVGFAAKGAKRTMAKTVGYVLSDVFGAIKGLAVPLVLSFAGLRSRAEVVRSSLRLAVLDSLMAIGTRY